jgi:hypothetical protein
VHHWKVRRVARHLNSKSEIIKETCHSKLGAGKRSFWFYHYCHPGKYFLVLHLMQFILNVRVHRQLVGHKSKSALEDVSNSSGKIQQLEPSGKCHWNHQNWKYPTTYILYIPNMGSLSPLTCDVLSVKLEKSLIKMYFSKLRSLTINAGLPMLTKPPYFSPSSSFVGVVQCQLAPAGTSSCGPRRKTAPPHALPVWSSIVESASRVPVNQVQHGQHQYNGVHPVIVGHKQPHLVCWE